MSYPLPDICPRCGTGTQRDPDRFGDMCLNPSCSWITEKESARPQAPCMHVWSGHKDDPPDNRHCLKAECGVYLLDYVRFRSKEMGVPVEFTMKRPSLIDQRLAR